MINKEILPIIDKLHIGINDTANIDKDYLYELSTLIDQFYLDNKINKETLISKWIQINGEIVFKCLQSDSIETFIKVLPTIIKSALEYMSKYNDILYLFAELSISIDWTLYEAINLGTN